MIFMSLNPAASLSTNSISPSSHHILLPGRRKVVTFLLYALWIGIGSLPLLEGLAYYMAPYTERPYIELHELYKPSGTIGQGLGILGTLMMVVGVFSYMLRKRWKVLHRFGKLRDWLTFHIFLCTLGPFLVLLHTTFKFGNIASVSFWSMAIVVGSGIFGRYVYIRIPKTVNGQFLSPQVLKQAQISLIQRISKRTQLPVEYIESLTEDTRPSGSILRSVVRSIGFELRKRSLKQRFDDALQHRGVGVEARQWALPLLVDNAHLQIRAQVMQPFIRAFGYWHVLHIPLALVMLVALLIHIGVAIAFGYTWIF